MPNMHLGPDICEEVAILCNMRKWRNRNTPLRDMRCRMSATKCKAKTAVIRHFSRRNDDCQQSTSEQSAVRDWRRIAFC